MFKIEADVEDIRESVWIVMFLGMCTDMHKDLGAHVTKHMCIAPYQAVSQCSTLHLLLRSIVRHRALLHATTRQPKHSQVIELQESASAISRRRSATKETKRIATMYTIQEDRCVTTRSAVDAAVQQSVLQSAQQSMQQPVQPPVQQSVRQCFMSALMTM